MRLLLIAAVALLAFPAQAQDVSASPTYGDVRLTGGFTPDPHVTELTAGGSVDVTISGCAYGEVANAPDVDLYYTASGGHDLYIYAVSSIDTTILINTPNGSWVCDDDSYDDGDPLVVIRNAPSGLYDIWVGTYGSSNGSATLFISEIDPR